MLPIPVRERLGLKPRDDLEVRLEDDDTISLRRVAVPANRGLVDHLLACPAPFSFPVRESDDTAALRL